MKKQTATVGFGAFLLASLFAMVLLPEPANFVGWGICLSIATYCMGQKHAPSSNSDNKTKGDNQ